MARDAELIRIVDAALAEAVRKSGAWLACRPGCAECCIGPFPISPLDAQRLQAGLRSIDPAVAARIVERARESVERLERDYPGDTAARVIAEDEAGQDELCPALDPETRTCDLYASRPITCRTFGPPMRMGSESLAICELCFDGATPEEIEACEVEIEPKALEAALAADGESETIVAYALLCST